MVGTVAPVVVKVPETQGRRSSVRRSSSKQLIDGRGREERRGGMGWDGMGWQGSNRSKSVGYRGGIPGCKEELPFVYYTSQPATFTDGARSSSRAQPPHAAFRRKVEAREMTAVFGARSRERFHTACKSIDHSRSLQRCCSKWAEISGTAVRCE